ncbi:hypothetical protein BH09BAC2_BH09BAC2_16420 [soil metagenome]
MASKKYKLLLTGVFILLASGLFAQTTSNYSIYDSSVIANKSMAQQNEFLNNTYDFPAKPRNMWEFGVSAGLFNVSGDVDSRILAPGFSGHLRKALGYMFSLRLQYTYGVAQGLNGRASENYGKNPAWTKNLPVAQQYKQGVDYVFYNYRSKVQDLHLEGIFTLNNILFHKQNPSTLLYVGIGGGATAYHTMINAYNESAGTSYKALFGSIPISEQTYDNRKNVYKKLRDGMDKTYETEAETAEGVRRTHLGANTLRPSATFIAGLAFKLSSRINLAIEDKFTIIHDDLLDGQRWAEQPARDASLTPGDDAYNYASLGLNINLGSRAKRVEPLYWINPLTYAYSELNNPKHMKLPKPVLDDTDNDGVIDQLDQEPNTPAGCPVNTHGVSLDTDGDGVPDCKDKQLITPTECQPVDADGVGKCPPPACCSDSSMRGGGANNACAIGDLPSIAFRGTGSTLSGDAKAMLATVATKLKANVDCAVTVTGYPVASKASQALANRRVNAIKMYLIESQGISADRVTTNVEVGGGDANTVDIKGTSK